MNHPREEPTDDACDGVENLALQLATELDDPASLPYFRVIAATVPADVVGLALERALAVPARRIRRSRAAYFTSLVESYRRVRSPGPPYAASPSPST